MSREYSDPTRENDPYALSDVEVFYADDLACEECCDGEGHQTAGWFYWYCFPGCMPEDGPWGPFDTKEEAIEAMREDASC